MPPRIQSASVVQVSSICRCHDVSIYTPYSFLRQFSSSPSHHARFHPVKQSKARRLMWAWINGPAAVLKYPLRGSTNYMGAYDREGNLIRRAPARNGEDAADGGSAAEDGEVKPEDEKNDNGSPNAEALDGNSARAAKAQDKDPGLPPETFEDLRPFPLNPFFRSEPVLSEELRTEIYRLHLQEEKTVREISIQHSVEMSRVAAVIRLKTVEQDWIRQGKPLARQYNDAIMGMLPKTPWNREEVRNPRHESINDLPVHASTQAQIFHPTSESRHFTRVDAGKVFHPKLLPADDRIPHPEMIETIKDRMGGMRALEQRQRQSERIAAMEQQRKDAKERKRTQLEARTKNVPGVRWDFKFEDLSGNDVGKNGRAPNGVGWRYGFPHEDRKRAQVKIPTVVE